MGAPRQMRCGKWAPSLRISHSHGRRGTRGAKKVAENSYKTDVTGGVGGKNRVRGRRRGGGSVKIFRGPRRNLHGEPTERLSVPVSCAARVSLSCVISILTYVCARAIYAYSNSVCKEGKKKREKSRYSSISLCKLIRGRGVTTNPLVRYIDRRNLRQSGNHVGSRRPKVNLSEHIASS